MSNNKNLPSFESLFGDLDFKKGDEGRSVYSPAAYLADLLQLLEDYFKFSEGEIQNRREDIAKDLLLNNDNTFAPVPYLDIVNKLLEARVISHHNGDPAFDTLKSQTYPFALPLNLEDEKYKKMLGFVNVGAADLYKIFIANESVDPVVTALEYLNLSHEVYTNIVTEPTDTLSYVEDHYGLALPALKDKNDKDITDQNGKPVTLDTLTQGLLDASMDHKLKSIIGNTPGFFTLSGLEARLTAILGNVDNFLIITGLSGAELRELLTQNLRTTATTNGSGNNTFELSEAANFYINHFAAGKYAKLNAGEVKMEMDGDKSPSIEWFVRVNKFITLAKKIGISFTGLDLILRSCCNNVLDEKAIQNVAVIKQVHDNFELSIERACCFFSDLNILGIGNDDEPSGTFNDIFNSKFAAIENAYLSYSSYIPKEYSSHDRIKTSGDILEDANRTLRKRLTRALDISEKEFTFIIQKYRDRYPDEKHIFDINTDFGINSLSLLFRIVQINEILDLSFREFFTLIDIIEKDPSIRKFAQFSLLMYEEPSEMDCYRILEGRGTVMDLFWLVQVMIALGKWMQASDFTAEELKRILTGEPGSEKETEAGKKRKTTFLNELYSQFSQVALKDQLFVSERFDVRTSRTIHRAIIEKEELVSAKDNRLARFDKAVAIQVAYDTLSNLERIHPDDFRGLGLEEKMVDKIFNNLTIKGYTASNGRLVEDAFPKDPADFRINFTGDESKAVFAVIHNLYQQENNKLLESANGNGQDVPVDIALFMSDLNQLELDETRKTELYDNLIFNSYLDEEGSVMEPQFFADPDNLPHFEINARIDTYSEDVYKIIKDNLDRFERSSLKLNPEIFSSLPLKEIEKQDLIENLVFNEYIDEDHHYTDKNELVSLPVKDFNIALQFYPHRHEILATLQQQLATFKDGFYRLNKAMFVNIAERMVANLIYERMEEEVLEDGYMGGDAKAFFADPENIDEFRIGPYFTQVFTHAVFNVIANINKKADQYRLTADNFYSLGFAGNEVDELISLLIQDGYIIDVTIPVEKIPFFLNINNALLFKIEGFGDFEKDVFFILHDLAKMFDAGIKEISERIRLLSEDQEHVLLNALQDYIELSAPLARVICNHVFRQPVNMVEEMMVPVFKSVNKDGQITEEPDHKKFNFALKRVLQFAFLAAKLGMGEKEADVAFRDQDLVEKFPEQLILPEGVTGFDALLHDTIDASETEAVESEEESLEVIYMFVKKGYYIYDAEMYNLLTEDIRDLKELSQLLENIEDVDAAFVDIKGNSWIIAGEKYFTKEKGREEWESEEKAWGKVDNNFDDPEKVEAIFVDRDGNTYMFSGDQYVRYSTTDYTKVDPGYPKKIKGNWENEMPFALPEECSKPMDAGFHGDDDVTYIFHGDKFFSSEDPSKKADINKFWGRVENIFEKNKAIETCMSLAGGKMVFYAGDQQLQYGDSIENPGVMGREGTLVKRARLHEEKEANLDAALRGFNEVDYHFSKGRYTGFAAQAAISGSGPVASEHGEIESKWGRIKNTISGAGQEDNNEKRNAGIVDAVLAGLDGRVYLFCGDQYFRYTGPDYSKVDVGYPRNIADDWKGMKTAEAAVVLVNKTFIFGRDEKDNLIYLQYSTNDYNELDEDFPKSPDDNWWNFPENLTGSDFFVPENPDLPFIPDASFRAPEGETYLFKDGAFIVSDHNCKWWSEPQQLTEKWDSIPFDAVAGAFTGKDGKTYIFEETNGPKVHTNKDVLDSKNRFIVYTDKNFQKTADVPRLITSYWGNVVNNIERYKKVDAALAIRWVDPEVKDKAAAKKEYTYLFSGDQFFRYTGRDYKLADVGYPKSIKDSLKEEPNFENLEAEFEQGIDAAFADQRNIYLFKGSTCHIVSNEIYTEYSDRIPNFNKVAFMEEGSMIYEQIIEEEGQVRKWVKINNLEAEGELGTQQVMPVVIRKLPEEFSTFGTDPDAILFGTDGNSYIFKEGECYNSALEEKYPLEEEWGIVKNNIAIDNKIDAALIGLDGRIYLFCGDQFIAYEKLKKGQNLPDFTSDDSPVLADGLPKSIAEHWGGLENVHIAFVNDNITYLLEKPDEYGNFRYLSLEGDDYSELKNSQVNNADFSWWNIPAVYIKEGFTNVDAVIIEKGKTFLISGKSFIQYNSKEDLWTYERPMERLWRKIPFNDTDFEVIRTVLTGRDGAVYFFSDEAFVKYEEKDLTPVEIKRKWGIIDNNIVQHKKVDAAFVYDNRETFLFSGDQYVKYTNDHDHYHYVDEGYPKKIKDSLREEEAFKNLPHSFEERMEKASRSDVRIDAVIANKGNIYLFEKNKNTETKNETVPLDSASVHVASYSLNRECDISHIGRIKNNIAANNKIDAAVVRSGKTYLFSGDQEFLYSDSPYEFVDPGYPRSLSDRFRENSETQSLNHFRFDLDSVLMGSDSQVYCFKDKNYVMMDQYQPWLLNTISDKWGKVNNNFAPAKGEEENISLDAAFLAPDGSLYMFKRDENGGNNQFAKYTDFENEFMDEGYPLPVENNWGDLPNRFEDRIDGAFVFEEKAYLIKTAAPGGGVSESGDDAAETDGGESVPGRIEYVRYSDARYREMDSIYPQFFTSRWGNWNDFLLNDIKNITKYIHLNNEYSGADHTLTDFFYEGNAYKKEPYEMLAEIFDWDIEELKWLKRKNAFIKAENQYEVRFEIEQVLNIYEIFKVAGKMGGDPYDIYDNVWLKRFDKEFKPNSPAMPSDAIYRFLGTSNSDKDWQVLKNQFHAEMNLLKRDALVPYVIHITPEVESPRELSNLLLIDVEMGSEATTSNIKEAISAIQLFIHRYFVSLEKNTLDDSTRADLKNWWKWMKNYRVWEANRKVFLYPENYIRPELRDTKTPEFKKLEDELLQGELDEASVERAYKNYLDFYTEVSRLKIVGGYSYNLASKRDTNQLVFFGLTRSNPARYFYRTASFKDGATKMASWNPWLEVNVQINADRVYPVYAFGRIFVFWATSEVKVLNADNATAEVTTSGDGSTQTVSSENPDQFSVLEIYYSYYNLNKEWMPVQKLQINNKEDKREDFAANYNGALQNIRLYVENSNVLGDFDYEHILIRCGFDVKYDNVLDESRVIYRGKVYNVSEGKVDLLKYGMWDLETLKKNVQIFPTYKDVVTEEEAVFHFKPNLLAEEQPVPAAFPAVNKKSLMGIFKNGSAEPGTIIQLNTIDNSTDAPWFSIDHQGASFLAKPTTIGLNKNHRLVGLKNNKDALLPAWNKIDAAFNAPDGNNYFFQNKDTTKANPPQYMVLPADNSEGIQAPKTDFRWGMSEGIRMVKAIFHDRVNDKTYLFDPINNGYFTYSRGGYQFTGANEYQFTDKEGRRPVSLSEITGPNLSNNEFTDFWRLEGRPFIPNMHGDTLPSTGWEDIDTVLQDGDGTTYFFRKEDDKSYFVSSKNLDYTREVTDTWGKAKVRKAFPKHINSAIGAFVFNDRAYFLTEQTFIRYTYPKNPAGDESTFMDMDTLAKNPAGDDATFMDIHPLAKNLDFGGLLFDMGILTESMEDQLIDNEKVVAAYHDQQGQWEQILELFNKGETFTENIFIKTDGGDPSDTDKARAFILKIAGGGDPELEEVSDRVNEVFEWTAGTTKADDFDWDKISAAYYDESREKCLIFSEDKYVSLSGEKNDAGFYSYIDAGYPKLMPGAAGGTTFNPDNLPPAWSSMDAVFRNSVNGKTYFFKGTKYVVSDDISTELDIEDRWGIVPNNILLEGVDAAYVDQQRLYLFRGDEYVRYTLNGNNILATIDYLKGEGDVFHKKLKPGVTVSAVCQQENKIYLFSGDKYTSLNPGEDPGILDKDDFEAIKGNWGNVRNEMKTGIDAALNLNNDQLLYFFKGNTYVKYGGYDNDDAHYKEDTGSPVMPFEIGTTVYDIIRLSTSTGYKLNQILFEGGLPALLRKETQEEDELPKFTTDPGADVKDPEVVALNAARVNAVNLPNNTYLDFDSSIGIYYWEIFFHAPYLIAQTLNTNQKFEESRNWFEYIFDPTEVGNYWKFLPFLSVDLTAMINFIDETFLKLDRVVPTKLEGVKGSLNSLVPIFNGERELTQQERDQNIMDIDTTDAYKEVKALSDVKIRKSLEELLGIIDRLPNQYGLMHPPETQLQTFMNDPFDPHAIAALRRIAYRKAIVMAYIDNLLDWGDLLFRQYTVESINEARMLYVLGYDLLGHKPEGLGNLILSGDQTYKGLNTKDNGEVDFDFLLEIESGIAISPGPNTALTTQGPLRVLDSMLNLYFYIPENEQFTDYWNRVEDRLYKIRHSLNILGKKQLLPLFQPPIDPMSIVSAVGSGASIGQATVGGMVSVPHYRFDFMLTKAKELVQKLDQFGNELLGTLEKKDAEALSLMQTEFEGMLLDQTMRIKEAQLEESKWNIVSLESSKKNAEERRDHYAGLIKDKKTDWEHAQIALMTIGSTFQTGAAIGKLAAAALGVAPQMKLGPFIVGTETGGDNWSKPVNYWSEFFQATGESLSMLGEAMGIEAQYQRMEQDWELQEMMAISDLSQIEAQLVGADHQKQIAQYDIEMLEKQMEQNKSVGDFMKDKFSNEQLYQWMASKLSGLYYQTYKMAYDMAKYAEKAYQFERAATPKDVNFIQPVYWDSQRKGLLSGSMLGHDLDRMEKHYLETNFRLFEISKEVSMLELDPMAFIQLKTEGVCEFSLTEALFDYDFPGHFCRQITTVSLTFDIGEGVYINATLTQLNNKVVLEADPKAVKFLLQPKGQQPETIRSDWRANQQVALSYFEDYEKNNGLFELRFDSDRYLPFEGTGVVSNWRLEINGKKSAYNLNDLVDLFINVKYTSINGGEVFANAVKGMLKPYAATKFIDLNYDFHNQWLAFLDNDSDTLELIFDRRLFPDMASGKITGIFTKYDLLEPGQVSMILNDDDQLTLKDGKFIEPTGVSISSKGSRFKFKVKGDKRLLRTVNFVMGYKAKV